MYSSYGYINYMQMSIYFLTNVRFRPMFHFGYEEYININTTFSIVSTPLYMYTCIANTMIYNGRAWVTRYEPLSVGAY